VCVCVCDSEIREKDSYDTQEIMSLLWAVKDGLALPATVTTPVAEYELSQTFSQ